LDLFSIGTIVIPKIIQYKPISKLNQRIDVGMVEKVFEPHVEQVCVLLVNLVIPLDIVKQHLLRTLFQLEIGEMFIDEHLFGTMCKT
jgi:hypothetical protein